MTSGVASLQDRAERLRWQIVPATPHAAWLHDWIALNQAAFDTPVLSEHMLVPALQRFGNGSERVAIARRGDRVVAMAVTRPTSSSFTWATFQPSQLPLSALVVSGGETLPHVGESLLNALPLNVLALSISQLDSALVQKPAAQGRSDVLPHLLTGAIELPADAEQYFSSRPASLRQNVAKRMRRAALDVGEPRLELRQDAGSVESYLALYSATESSGWKGRANSAVRLDDDQGAFYRDMLTRAAHAGQARMFVLWFGDVPVAQQIALEHRGVLYLMKTTYDERYRTYAPGVLQRMHVLRWAAGQKAPIRRIEIYGRLNDSQRPFITGSREIFHATFFRHEIVRRVRDAVRQRMPAASAPDPDVARQSAGAAKDRAAATAAPNASPFATTAWFELLERTCFASIPGKAIRVASPSSPSAYLPLWHRKGTLAGVLTGLSNYYTPLLEPTGSEAQKQEVARELARFLHRYRNWSELRLQPLAEDSSWLATLASELDQAGLMHDRYFCFGNWFIDVDGASGQSFERTLPSQLRNTIARADRRLRKQGTVEISILAHGDDAELLRRSVGDFEAVYARSWKRPEPFPKFITGLFELAAKTGSLRAGILRLDGRPIAAQLWLTQGRVASIYKLAYDSDFARFSPGSVLTMAMARYAIDVDRVRQIDYLIGDDAYKQAWMNSHRRRVGLVVFNRASPAGLCKAAMHYSGKWMKRTERGAAIAK